MWYDFIMKTLFLFGRYVFCGETIMPEGLSASQLSF